MSFKLKINSMISIGKQKLDIFLPFNGVWSVCERVIVVGHSSRNIKCHSELIGSRTRYKSSTDDRFNPFSRSVTNTRSLPFDLEAFCLILHVQENAFMTLGNTMDFKRFRTFYISCCHLFYLTSFYFIDRI